MAVATENNIPKYILINKTKWVWHKSNKFQTQAVALQMERSKSNQMGKLFSHYNNADTLEKKFVFLGARILQSRYGSKRY